MLFKELIESDSCYDCPFYGDFCPGGWSGSPSGPVEPPCTNWDDNDDVYELYNDAVEGCRRHEAAEDRRIQREQELKKKKEERNKKSRESRWEVRQEQREIKALRKIIDENDMGIRHIIARLEVSGLMREVSQNELDNANRMIENIRANNRTLQARIDQLSLIKKVKLKALRDNRK